MKELGRQSIHLLLGCGVALTVLALGRLNALALFGAALAIGVILSLAARSNKNLPVLGWFLGAFERKGAAPGKGTLRFIEGSTIALLLFDVHTVFLAILVLAFGDSFSTVVGIGFGKKKVYGGKSLEGTIAFFLASLAITLPFASPTAAILVSIAGALVELLSPIDDNLAIPPAAGLVIYLTGAL